MWSADARRFTVPTPSPTGPQAVPTARRPESRRATRCQERKFSQWRLDCRRYSGAPMAEVARALVRQERGSRMKNKPAAAAPAVADPSRRQRPVRVKLTRADAFEAATYPPDGETENWWRRLNQALGTVSSDFTNASLLQLQAAARSPYGKISETAMNAALAMVEAAAPRDEIEAALAIQMACTHTAAMAVLAKIDRLGSDRRIALFASTAARLMKTFAMQVEVRRRLRNGGQQHVRVEHVHVNGGQALIGNVKG
jgi:hypothetical protein